MVGVLIGLAFLLSSDKKRVNYKAIGIMLGLQVLTTLFMFQTSIGQQIVLFLTEILNRLIEFGEAGIDFVMGGFQLDEGGVFFINVLLLIVFFSMLLSVLTYLKILPRAINLFGGILSKVTGLPRVESFNAVNSIFFGQSEAILAIKSQVSSLDRNRLFIVCVSAMASVSASVVGVYITMLPAEYVLVAFHLICSVV